MKIKNFRLNSFQTKVTLAFVLCLLFIAGLGNFFLYNYSINSQFSQIREKLLVIARNAALSVDTQALSAVPLNHDGINSQEYKVVLKQLEKLKEINPSLKYIYTLTKTDQPGIWQFIVDPNPISTRNNPQGPTAFPGDKYDVSRFPEMVSGYMRPTADRELVVDEWGVTLSGYAPIRDAQGKTIAVLGVDIDANSIYQMQKAIKLHVVFVLIFAVVISLVLGIWISRKVTKPVAKLVEGTRKIASGDLSYKVEIEAKDEIGELAASFNNMASSLSEARKKLHEYFYRIVQTMVRSLEAKDSYTRGHSDRVSEYTEKIALEMGFPASEAELLKKAAQLHDVGKLGIRESVLNKKGLLSEDEWDLIHKHPVVGEEILRPIFLDQEMLSVIRSHHERCDGKGYPDGLKEDEISIFAQIVCVADAYDAMTSDRAYRPTLSMQEGIARLKNGVGTQFNPKIVEAFIRVLSK
ncbi:HD domain-containing protein [bacterium]|nr:MAG: HD domain-containing protein [bacterium]